jgi:hypothetical protein
MAVGRFATRIAFLRVTANRLRSVALRRHFRAALLARRALVAKQNGHHLRARNLLRRALMMKAAAARAGVRSRIHRMRIVKIRQARRLRAQRQAGRA